MRPHALVLISGGLDSLVSLACALEELDFKLALFFNYGQSALAQERRAALRMAKHYGIPYKEVALTWLSSLLPGPMAAAEGELSNLADVWIPNRNGVFLNVAAAFAEGYGCRYLVTGFNAEEAVEFPDNRAEFVVRMNSCLSLSTMNKVKVKSYVQDMDKAAIVVRGIELGAPLSLVWSCYRGGELMCGRCSSCRRLRQALAGIPPGKRPPIEFESR